MTRLPAPFTARRSVLISLCIGALTSANILPREASPPSVDTRYPYTGASVPFGDILDPTINGNGKGLVRLSEPPAVSPPLGVHPTNNINVISTGYVPGGMNIHFQTPFGIGEAPVVLWGEDRSLGKSTTGGSSTWVS